jgi:hypothetical protein
MNSFYELTIKGFCYHLWTFLLNTLTLSWCLLALPILVLIYTKSFIAYNSICSAVSFSISSVVSNSIYSVVSNSISSVVSSFTSRLQKRQRVFISKQDRESELHNPLHIQIIVHKFSFNYDVTIMTAFRVVSWSRQIILYQGHWMHHIFVSSFLSFAGIELKSYHYNLFSFFIFNYKQAERNIYKLKIYYWS